MKNRVVLLQLVEVLKHLFNYRGAPFADQKRGELEAEEVELVLEVKVVGHVEVAEKRDHFTACEQERLHEFSHFGTHHRFRLFEL